MRAMVLDRLGSLAENPEPLRATEQNDPAPGSGEVLLRVLTCGVCHTELDEIEGRTPPPRLPIVLGHQVVGRVEALGDDARLHQIGDRVGVAWIFSACGTCAFCRLGQENLCPQFQATGRDANGGYAEFMTVPEAFAYPIPDAFNHAEAAPLLCAGAIGYRALRLTGLRDGQRLGLTGFGASGHLVLSLARHQFPNASIGVFARSESQRAFALELGADWALETQERPPEPLNAIIDTTPAWTPILFALRHLAPGGRLVVNAIRKEDQDKATLLQLDYAEHLWLEKEVKTVANITRLDVAEFLRLAAEIPLRPEVQEYPLAEANRALWELSERKIRGAKVLIVK